jgi:hypothetical protein
MGRYWLDSICNAIPALRVFAYVRLSIRGAGGNMDIPKPKW